MSGNSGKGKSRASERRKATMARSWARAQTRRRERRDAQNERHRANLATVKAGGQTPWQASCAARFARRHPVREAA